MSNPIRVLLVDDHAMLRAGLRALLECEPDMVVAAEAATGEAAVETCEEGVRPDVVVMDLTMPGAGGLAALRRMQDMKPSPAVLILTMHEQDECLTDVLAAGGRGYLNKADAEPDLARAVRAVARGTIWLPGSRGAVA
jgi:two-component system, NarL family, response regulator NreC